jgi:hypothetical protein
MNLLGTQLACARSVQAGTISSSWQIVPFQGSILPGNKPMIESKADAKQS